MFNFLFFGFPSSILKIIFRDESVGFCVFLFLSDQRSSVYDYLTIFLTANLGFVFDFLLSSVKIGENG